WFGPRLWSASVAAALGTAGWVLLTGALHLDGVADSADGLSAGHRDRDRALAVMRDSHVGAHGAVAIVLGIGLKFALCLRLASTLGLGDLATGLLVTTAAPRTWTAVALATLPHAEGSTMAAAFGGPGARGGAAGAVAALLLLAGGAVGFAPPRAAHTLTSLLLTGMVAYGLARAATRRFGGLNGDVCGAAIELGELSGLLVWSTHG